MATWIKNKHKIFLHVIIKYSLSPPPESSLHVFVGNFTLLSCGMHYHLLCGFMFLFWHCLCFKHCFSFSHCIISEEECLFSNFMCAGSLNSTWNHSCVEWTMSHRHLPNLQSSNHKRSCLKKTFGRIQIKVKVEA